LKIQVKAWLKGLLQDPEEKVRRYAMAAIPKLGEDVEAERNILTILKTSTVDREKRKAGAALEKIAGEETLKAVGAGAAGLPLSEQKVRANVARRESPATIRVDAILDRYDTLRISLRCRRGLEAVLADEVRASDTAGGKFRVLEVRGCHVVVAAKGPFSLRDLYQLRCFDTMGFGLGRVRDPEGPEAVAGLAKLIGSPLSERLMDSLTDGSWRYRLSFSGSENHDDDVAKVAAEAFKVNPPYPERRPRGPVVRRRLPRSVGCLGGTSSEGFAGSASDLSQGRHQCRLAPAAGRLLGALGWSSAQRGRLGSVLRFWLGTHRDRPVGWRETGHRYRLK
jgi:hypothetical protein